MDSFEHTRSRPLHRYRHGLDHYRQHRDGKRHEHRRRKRRRNRVPSFLRPETRRPALIAATVVAVVVLLGAFIVYAGYAALERARTQLTTAELSISSVSHNPSLLTSAVGRAELRSALTTIDAQASSAASTVNGSTALNILSFFPIVGRQVDGTRNLVNDLHTTSTQATDLLGSLDQLTAHSTATNINLADLNNLTTQVASSLHVLNGLPTSTAGLIGPVRSAQAKFNADITRVTSLLANGHRALTYALPLLGADGPRTYFLAAQNNAEMRDQGAVLSWALINTSNGSYSANSPQSVDTLPLYSPAPYPLPAGTEEVFGPLEPTQIWQSTNATADFPLSGPVMASMYTKATHGATVNGVIAIDVIGLKDLLTLTGPVSVPSIDKVVTSANVVPLTLHTLYKQFPAGDPQGARHDVLSTIAKAVVDNLKHSKVDVGALVKTLAKATQGRHLLVWDANPRDEATVAAFGASGSVSAVDPTDTFHLAVESAVAAKLDYYIRTSVSYQVQVAPSGDAYVSTQVTIHNLAPRGAKGSYVLGPDHVNSFTPGEYVSRIYLWSPAGSLVAGGINESGLVVNPTSAVVDAGSSTEIGFQTVIPHAVTHGVYRLHLIPQSSLVAQATTVSFSGQGVALTPSRTFSLIKPVTLTYRVATP